MIYKGFRVVEVSMRSVGIHGIRKKRRAQKRPGRTLKINFKIFSIKHMQICLPRGSIASKLRRPRIDFSCTTWAGYLNSWAFVS